MSERDPVNGKHAVSFLTFKPLLCGVDAADRVLRAHLHADATMDAHYTPNC